MSPASLNTLELSAIWLWPLVCAVFKDRPAEAAGGQTVQKCPPGRLALTAHVLEAEQHLLPVAAHAESDQNRQPGGALVETNAHDRSVEHETNDVVLRQVSLLPRLPVRPHLVPGPAHHVLADGPAEQRTERPSHPPGVGAGGIGSGDQRLGPPGEPPVGRDRLVAPFRRPAIRPSQTRARNR